MKKTIFTLFILLSLISCQKEEKNTILEGYESTLGNPTNIKEESQGNTIYYTYIWDTSESHSELILSKTSGKWEEVRFTQY